MGNVLDLNSSIEKESQFVDIPEGEYDAIVDHVETDVCQWSNEYNGNPMISVYLNIQTPEGEGQLRDNIVLNSDFEWKLSQFFLGTGQKKKGEPLPNLGRGIAEAPGLRVRVKIVKREGKGDKAGTFYSNVDQYIEKKPVASGAGWNPNGGF